MSYTPVAKQFPRRSKLAVQTYTSTYPGLQHAEVNIAIVGALGAGKSALTVKYITRRFISEYDPDLEDTYVKNEKVDQREITVKIMDTCDKEDKDPTRYLNWADAFLVVYSITSRPSFEAAQNYMQDIAQHHRTASSSMDTPTILVGNKLDLERYRQVCKTEGKVLAAQYDSAFYETTAAEEYDCIVSVFHEAIREVLQEYERSTPLRPLFITEDRSSAASTPQSITIMTHQQQLVPTTGGVLISQHEKNSRFKFFNSKGLKSIFQSI